MHLRLWPVALVVAVALAAATMPGTSATGDEPEITDPQGQTIEDLWRGDLIAPEIDILALDVWDAGNDIGITWYLDDLTHRQFEGEDFSYHLTWKASNCSLCWAKASYLILVDEWWMLISIIPPDGEGSAWTWLEGDVDEDASTVTVYIPREWAPFPWNEVAVGSILAAPKATSPGTSGGGPVWWRDTAPTPPLPKATIHDPAE